MESLPVPFHFTASFVVAMVAAGATWITFTRREFAPQGRWARASFVAGWGLLTLSEIAHGAFLVGEELSSPAVALRSGAYALLTLGLMSRPKEAKAVAAVAPAPGAALPTLVSFAAAYLAKRSALPAAGRLALSFLMFGASEIAFSITPGSLSGAEADPGLLWAAAHGLRLAGGAALGVWLWRAFSSSIQVRFVAVFVVLLLVVVVGISGTMTQVFASNVRREALRETARVGELQNRRLEDQIRESLRLGRLIAQLADTRADLTDVDSAAIAARARSIQAPGGLFEQLDFIAFLDPNGAIVGISSEGQGLNLDETDAVSLAGSDIVKSALEGTEAGSIDVIGARRVGIVSAVPVLKPPGRDPPGAQISLAGAVVLGRLLDLEYVESLRAGGGTHFTIVTREASTATTFAPGSGGGATVARDAAGILELGRTTEREAIVEGVEYFSSYVPLERPDGEIVGAIVISRPSQVLELTQANVGRTLFALASAAAAVALALAFLFGSRITRPIVDLTQAAERVRHGDLRARVDVSGADEVGALGSAFNEMTDSIARLTGDLRDSANEEFRLRSRLETILQSMADGVVAVDSDGKVLALNREAERITGVTEGRGVGLAVEDVLVARDSAGNPVSLPIYDLEGGAVGGVLVSSARNSSATPVAITSAPIRSENGEVTGAVAVVRDLTAEMEVERMKTEFLSNISHELRTPLTPIKGYTEMLRRRNVPRPTAIRFLDSIMDSTHRLERIVEMLVDLSSIEAGRLELRALPTNLDAATASLVDKWKKEAPKHRFERTGFRALPKVNVDERLLPRAIDELIDNAVKFSPNGGKITLSATVEKGSRSQSLRLSVIDRGLGIEPEAMERIFGDFIQGDASATRKFGGLGLGLGYVKRIVEEHGGYLEAESTPSRGSEFSMVIPMGPIGPARSASVPRGRSGMRSRKPRGKSIPKKT